MIVAVLDTNTIVSATLVGVGHSGQIVAAARAGHFQWVTSAPIIAEVVRTLLHRRIQRKYRVTPDDVERIRELLEADVVGTAITVTVEGVATHPEDDLILATAVSARADYLVTGDRHLQKLNRFRGVEIVSPRTFVDILAVSARR